MIGNPDKYSNPKKDSAQRLNATFGPRGGNHKKSVFFADFANKRVT